MGANMIESITILLPIHNGGRYFPQVSESVSKMAGPNDEILVINDGSTDTTSQALTLWRANEPRLRVIKIKKSGLVNALNIGLNESSNDWVARADVDDTYSNTRLVDQRLGIKNSVVALFSDYSFVTLTGKELGVIPSAIHSPAVEVSLVSGQRTAHPSVLYNRDAVLAAGAYRESDFPAEDLSLWLRLARIGSLCSVPRTLLNHTLNGASVTATRRISSIAKRNELLNSIGISQISIETLFDNWEQIFDAYRSETYCNQRQVLLFRDLRMIENFGSLSNAQKRSRADILRSLLGNPGFTKSVLDLAISKYRRNHYRKSFNVSSSQ